MVEYNVQFFLFGIFYCKVSFDVLFYVEVGQVVEVGSVIGLIEVMKQFFEVQVGQVGIFQVFYVEDGEVIELGQVLVVIVSVI